MIFLGQLQAIEDNKFSVGFIHYKAEDFAAENGKTVDELKNDGVVIDVLPIPEEQAGKYAQLFTDKLGNAWYEYIDVSLTPDQQEIQGLKQQLADTQNQLATQSSQMEAMQAAIDVLMGV